MNHRRTIFIATMALIAAPVLAGCAENADTPDDDETMTLRMGTLMPLTGALNALGPDMQNGAKLAIKQVNDADAGLRIEAFHRDDKTTDSAAITGTFNQLAAEGVSVIAGPCCSGVTASLLELAQQEQIVIASPSATSPTLTETDNGGYFWRVPPSDALQGKVLADLVAGDGVKTANMIIVNNAYGNGLAKVFQDTATKNVPPVVVTQVARYDEGQGGDFASQVTQVCGAPTPEAVVLVAYVDDGAAILKQMQNQGCLDKVKVYASEGVYDPQFPEKAGQNAEGKWLAAGVKGSAPTAANTTRFDNLFETEYGHKPGLYAAESYDAVMYLALAAIAAQSTEGADIQAKMVEIANAPGTKFNDFAQAAAALRNGDDIDWEGAAHDFEYDATKREPVEGLYAYWTVTENGEIEVTDPSVEA